MVPRSMRHALGRPLALVLDDLHWAGISSLRLLLFLARQVHDGSALVIGTYRDVDVIFGEPAARALLAELAGQSGLLQLTGLTAGEVCQLLSKVCGERPPTALIAAVHERTGGNSFFVQQTRRLLAAQGAPLDQASVTGVPRVVGDVLARRLARLPRDAVDLLGISAVAGTDPVPCRDPGRAAAPPSRDQKGLTVPERPGTHDQCRTSRRSSVPGHAREHYDVILILLSVPVRGRQHVEWNSPATGTSSARSL